MENIVAIERVTRPSAKVPTIVKVKFRRSFTSPFGTTLELSYTEYKALAMATAEDMRQNTEKV